MQFSMVKKFPDRQAKTDEPYKKTLSIGEEPTIAAAPIIKIPVPKKKQDSIDIPKYLLKITFKKVYRLAQPKLIMIFPNKAAKSEPKFTLKSVPVSPPAIIAPKRYETHIAAIAKAQDKVFDRI